MTGATASGGARMPASALETCRAGALGRLIARCARTTTMEKIDAEAASKNADHAWQCPHCREWWTDHDYMDYCPGCDEKIPWPHINN